MKCPKCGYNSFEYYDSCKKCSSDLISYKQTYSIIPLVLPLEAKERLAAEFRSAESETEQISETMEAHDDIFSFDLPTESASATTQTNDDPFNFDEYSPGENTASGLKSDDVFADLLESTSQVEGSPFAPRQVKEASASATVVNSVAPASSPGEFDLESFSWDETPTETSTAEVPDDFDSLFGETKENAPK